MTHLVLGEPNVLDMKMLVFIIKNKQNKMKWWSLYLSKHAKSLLHSKLPMAKNQIKFHEDQQLTSSFVA